MAQRTFNPWRLLLWLLFSIPFATAPKILLGFDHGALAFDALFALIFIAHAIGAKLHHRPLILFFWGMLFAINILYFFFSEIPSLYLQLTSYRLSSFYLLAFALPFFIKWDAKKINQLSKTICYSAVFVGINAIRQWLWPSDVEIAFANSAGGAAKFYGDTHQGGPDSFRVFSSFVTSVHLVIFMTLAFLIAYYQRFISGEQNKVYLFTIWLALTSIALTFSRSGWLAVTCAFAPMFLVHVKSKDNARDLATAFIIFVALITLILALYLSVDLFKSRLNTLINVSEVSAFQSRLDLWQQRLEQISNNPLGFGAGAAGWNTHETMSLGADSNYLKFILELGIFWGSATIMFLLCCFFVVCYRFSIRKRGYRFNIVIICFLIAIFVQMITNQITEAYPSNFFFWFMLGMGYCLTDNSPGRVHAQHK
jgi:hypothetical protein